MTDAIATNLACRSVGGPNINVTGVVNFSVTDPWASSVMVATWVVKARGSWLATYAAPRPASAKGQVDEVDCEVVERRKILVQWCDAERLTLRVDELQHVFRGEGDGDGDVLMNVQNHRVRPLLGHGHAVDPREGLYPLDNLRLVESDHGGMIDET